jgi:hypothetical protein
MFSKEMVIDEILDDCKTTRGIVKSTRCPHYILMLGRFGPFFELLKAFWANMHESLSTFA